MCAYGNSIATTRVPGLYTKLLVCLLLGLPVLCYREILEDGLSCQRLQKITEVLLAFSLSPLDGIFLCDFPPLYHHPIH